MQTENSKKVYETAKSLIGYNLCTNAQLGCAETVNEIFKRALGQPIGGGSSTQAMYPFLKDVVHFKEVSIGEEQPGDVIISPTGSPNTKFAHGHVGIIAQYGILSNSSSDGRLHENYDLETWQRYYGEQGGYPVYIFRPL